MSTQNQESQELWIVRHGETEWSRDGLHTSVTDLPLTEVGVEIAQGLKGPLSNLAFSQVLTSPRTRARHTAELAGFPDATVTDDLAEWFYGDYEGISTDEIRKTVPGWTIWNHPTPGAESAEEVTERLDRVVELARSSQGRTLAFAHGHSLRALTARWLGLPVQDGRRFRLDTSTISVLGWERENAVILRWNSPL